MRFTIETDVLVPMRDGTSLAACVWRPQLETPVPALLVRTPYGKSDVSQYGGTAPNIYVLAEAGYAVVLQDCRGTFGSEGIFVPHESEQHDAVDSIEWLAAQRWCDGNVGMYGRSYQGFVQWQAAAAAPPALKAIAPAASSADLYRAPWYSEGGALSLGTLLVWCTVMSLNMIRRESTSATGGQQESAAQLARILAGIRAAARQRLMNHPVLERYLPWINSALEHESRDAFWRDQAALEEAAKIQVPALSIGGWFDLFLGATLRAYRRMRADGATADVRDGQRLVIGPWSHANMTGLFPERSFGLQATPAAAGLTDAYLSFFDRWLRGSRSEEAATDRVRIFVMGINRWRSEPDWPLPDTAYTDYFLDGGGNARTAAGDGRLVQVAPAAPAADIFTYDPRDPVPTCGGVLLDPAAFDGPADQRRVQQRPDVLCFTTAPVAAALEVTGPVSATIFVSSSAVDTDFTAKLVDVGENGIATLLTEGILRMRYREGLAAPAPIEPERIYEIVIDMGATSNVFLPGHRICLEVSSSNFPRYDRNSNTGSATFAAGDDATVPAVNKVYHGAGWPGRVVLPVVSRPAHEVIA